MSRMPAINVISQIPFEYYDIDDGESVCYLCEKPRYQLFYAVTQYGPPITFKKCECGLVKQIPMPNRLFFEWFFNSDIFLSCKNALNREIWGYSDFLGDEACRFATSQMRYRMLWHLLEADRPLEILKIGPATGSFLHLAQKRGHHAVGCDLSLRFMKYAKNKYNVKIDHGRFENMNYADGQFDIILLFSVLENIPNVVEFITDIHRTLKDGGYFVFNFVDMEKNVVAALQKSTYFLFRPPVCYIYTMPVIKRVLGKYGFRIAEIYRDIRCMHIEKAINLFRMKSLLNILRLLKVNRLSFPMYAYPSKIIVARKI